MGVKEDLLQKRDEAKIRILGYQSELVKLKALKHKFNKHLKAELMAKINLAQAEIIELNSELRKFVNKKKSGYLAHVFRCKELDED